MKAIIIIGGGNCGWMSALFLKKKFPSVEIKLISSPNIPNIGVGESTLPYIVNFLKDIGISEKEIFQKCEATIKLGVLFSGWNKKKDFLHPFVGGLTSYDYENIPFAYWFKKYFPKASYEKICDSSLFYISNKLIPIDEKGDIESNYAYHIDANLLGEILQKKAKSIGVKHTITNIKDVISTKSNIEYIVDENEIKYNADLYLDCSGFSSILVGNISEYSYESFQDELPCDTAIFGRSPKEENYPLHTAAYRRSAGWSWKIPLQNYTGNGYVFSQKYQSIKDAKKEFASCTGIPLKDMSVVLFSTGVNKKSWIGNCVAMGFSNGFIEPLEATGIHIFCKQLDYLKDTLWENKREKFNNNTYKLYQEIKDFIILHYYVSDNLQDPFWNSFSMRKYNATFKRKILELKKAFPNRKLEEEMTCFSKESYTKLLLGLGWYENFDFSKNLSEKNFKQFYHDIQMQQKMLLSQKTCTQEEYINKIKN